MNCEHMQRRLLAGDGLDQPPVEVQSHLAACPACQEWQRQWVHLEEQIPLLPVPASAGKDELIQRILAMPPLPRGADCQSALPLTPRVEVPSWRGIVNIKDRGFRKLALACGLAAALVMFAIGSWIGRQGQPVVRPRKPPAADPLVAKVMQRDLRLARARTPLQRVEALADLADDLHAEARALAHAVSADDLTAFADWYREVVGMGLVKQAEVLAKTLPAGERMRVLEPIASRLLRAGNDIEQLAGEVAPAAAEALRTMVAAARDGDSRLRQLIAEG